MDDARAGISTLTGGTADLHLHSTASDGSCTPAEIVRRAVSVGLSVIALTDHDSVAGIAEAQALGRESGVDILTGCELSARAPWGEIHVLAYGISIENGELLEALDLARSGRLERAKTMVGCINKLGVALTLDDVLAASGTAPIGRPHVARALIAKKVVRSIEEAFDRFLGRGRPAFVPKPLKTVAETAGLARRSHGISSAAHLGSRGTPDVLDHLRANGIDALEIQHPSHSVATRQHLDSEADRLGFLKTGGSDWHGGDDSNSHRMIGRERIPLAWVARIREVSADRRP